LGSISFSDSDYARCEETRSVSSRVNALGGMLTNMTSKQQGSVNLSSREAERVAGTECANEAMFQSMLLEELLGRKVQATILINNTGAIFMVKNHNRVSSRTKHIAVQHLYVRELQERGEVKVEFIPTAQNVSKIGTKNLSEKLFNMHANRVLDGRILECLREDVKMYEVSEKSS
jgi:hypothetical protein